MINFWAARQSLGTDENYTFNIPQDEENNGQATLARQENAFIQFTLEPDLFITLRTPVTHYG